MKKLVPGDEIELTGRVSVADCVAACENFDLDPENVGVEMNCIHGHVVLKVREEKEDDSDG
jgi:hypothetical protein